LDGLDVCVAIRDVSDSVTPYVGKATHLLIRRAHALTAHPGLLATPEWHTALLTLLICSAKMSTMTLDCVPNLLVCMLHFCDFRATDPPTSGSGLLVCLPLVFLCCHDSQTLWVYNILSFTNSSADGANNIQLSPCHCNTFEQSVPGYIHLISLQIFSQNICMNLVNIF
jgi:hypothetical protein